MFTLQNIKTSYFWGCHRCLLTFALFYLLNFQHWTFFTFVKSSETTEGEPRYPQSSNF